MFGPETNKDKEQNTLSSVAFTVLSYRKAIGKLRKNYISNYLSVHKFQQPISSTTQKYQQIDLSYLFSAWTVLFCDELLAQAHIYASVQFKMHAWVVISVTEWHYTMEQRKATSSLRSESVQGLEGQLRSESVQGLEGQCSRRRQSWIAASMSNPLAVQRPDRSSRCDWLHCIYKNQP